MREPPELRVYDPPLPELRPPEALQSPPPNPSRLIFRARLTTPQLNKPMGNAITMPTPNSARLHRLHPTSAMNSPQPSINVNSLRGPDQRLGPHANHAKPTQPAPAPPMPMANMARSCQREDRLLIETDAPYLAPEPYRGKTNSPAYVPHVAARLAELRGVSVERIAEASTTNFNHLFSKACA